MIAVEFRYRQDDGDDFGSAGWYAMPVVPSVGESVEFGWNEHVADVFAVHWCFDVVPREVVNMRDAGLASSSGDDKKWLARVYVAIPPNTDESDDE